VPSVGWIIHADEENVLIIAFAGWSEHISQRAGGEQGPAKVASLIVLGREIERTTLGFEVQVALDRNTPAAPSLWLGKQLEQGDLMQLTSLSDRLQAHGLGLRPRPGAGWAGPCPAGDQQ
jgi:hypothetical protein